MTNSRQLEPKSEPVSQSPEEVIAEQVAEEESQPSTPEDSQQSAKAPVKKRKRPLPKEEDLMPRPSIWPLATTAAVSVALVGFAFQPIVCALGVVLLIGCIIGWIYDRR
ncbi:cytochrome c oxidase subunit 4 [Ktedonospora formicarum]|uniref:Cytochrome aa3 subunit 4 n=1 Tax=Ktedonospora formicarum TaxID=2778364 RepID=A0A8J3I1C2_9CHLR|nr:cytochrome c oxidase subunit 4 [Ktedonospora formicarum]GHO43714.1 hypothetical protein KSX_18770 [Ktedonospora formicarum]